MLIRIAAAALLIFASASCVFAQADGPGTSQPLAVQQISVPLRLDYPLLQKLLLTRVYTGANQTLEVLNDPNGCSEVVLSNPVITPRHGQLEIFNKIDARIGMGAPGACSTLLRFEGRMGIQGTPELQNNGTAIGFSPRRVWLLDNNEQRISNDALESVARGGVSTVFQRFAIDLKPQLDSFGDLLPAVLPRHSREQIATLLSTLRIVGVRVSDATLDADIEVSIETPEGEFQPEAALSEEELRQWEERWQLMDTVLVLAVKQYAAATQLQELRDALLDALIESRYRLRDALSAGPNAENDTVREWFLDSWQALAPTVRRIGLEQSGQEHLLLLGVITAGDALEALDRVGPSIGLDISADGVRRLARLMNEGAGEELLEYTTGIDPALRELLESSVQAVPPSTWHLNFSFFSRVIAADSHRLNRWAPKRADLSEYLPSVAALLQASTDKAADRRGLSREYRELFRRIVFTTAWQESCWRHYVVSDDEKLVPLRSGTGDVGLMQINERVWRGFYDQQQLRWDIDYNSGAGAEVLVDYLMRYALRRREHEQPGGITNLARATYSAYNGGPSKVARYRSPTASPYGRKVDAAFWDKYQEVAAGNELAVSTCLGGSLSGPALPNQVNATSTEAGTKSAFTLQLGAFSSEAAALKLIEQQGLGTAATVRKRAGEGTGDYLVLYGTYATRGQAEAAKARLSGLSSWIRQIKDIR